MCIACAPLDNQDKLFNTYNKLTNVKRVLTEVKRHLHPDLSPNVDMQRKNTNQSLGEVYLASSTARRETITNKTNASIDKSVLPVHLCTIKTSYLIHIIS